jgi:uncharacterized protein (DUF433 family)
MDSGRDLTLVEAAYLASACLVQESSKPKVARSRENILLDAALHFDPDKGSVSVRAVRVAVDEGIIKTWARDGVVVDENAVVYVAIVKLLTEVGELTPHAKNLLYEGIRRMAATVTLAPRLNFDSGAFAEECKLLLGLYRKRLTEWVVEDPELMGGLPCIRGTRIPVYTVLGRIEEGESFEEIAKDFSHVSRGALEAALVYARTHPRRGRPRRYR